MYKNLNDWSNTKNLKADARIIDFKQVKNGNCFKTTVVFDDGFEFYSCYTGVEQISGRKRKIYTDKIVNDSIIRWAEEKHDELLHKKAAAEEKPRGSGLKIVLIFVIIAAVLAAAVLFLNARSKANIDNGIAALEEGSYSAAYTYFNGAGSNGKELAEYANTMYYFSKQLAEGTKDGSNDGVDFRHFADKFKSFGELYYSDVLVCVLDSICDREYSRAAENMIKYSQLVKGIGSEDWCRVYVNEYAAAEKNSTLINDTLDYSLGLRYLQEQFPGEEMLFEPFKAEHAETAIRNKENYSDGLTAFKSVEAIAVEFGLIPENKIIIMEQYRIYDSDETYTAAEVDYNAMMELLPDKNFPKHISRIEYIVVQHYDYQKDKKLKLGDTKALYEEGYVELISAVSGESLYKSDVIEGERLPKDYQLSDTSAQWVSGGKPDLGEALKEAVNKAISLG